MEYVSALIGYRPVSVSTGFGNSVRRFLYSIHDHVIPHPRNNYHPHLLGHRLLGLFSLLLVTVKVATIVLLTTGPVLPAYSSAISSENITSLTNASRREFNLTALTLNTRLSQAAQAKAQALLECQCFSHNLPDGRSPWDFIKAVGYSYIVAGENLAVDFTDADNVEAAWMNSTGHRANILNADFEDIGIGIASGQFQGHQTTFVVQMFGSLAEQPIHTLAENNSTSSSVQLNPVVASAKEPTPPLFVTTSPSGMQQNTPESNLLTIINTDIQIKDNNIVVVVHTSGEASRVLALYGDKAVMLDAKPDNVWAGSIPLPELVTGASTITVEAFSMAGALAQSQVASFNASIKDNYNFSGKVDNDQINFFGWHIDPKQFANNFYLIFITLILVSLAIAIAVHRHVQHVGLVANGAFVVILATLLWWAA